MPLINITLSDQIKSFMDERHYDPNEIDNLYLPPNTNGETTWYVDGTNGNDSYDGLYPDNSLGGLHGPFKTIVKTIGQNDGHRYGERVLIRTGTYTIPYGSQINMNLSGIFDSNHYFTFAPYGDGEVIIDFSITNTLSNCSILTGNIYKVDFSIPSKSRYPIAFIMDWDKRNCRQAIKYYSTDNSGINDKTTSMVDTTKNFNQFVITFPDSTQTGPTNFVGGIIYNIRDRSYGIITSISTTTNPNDTVNFSGGLIGGTTNTFNNKDPYLIAQLDNDGKWLYVEHKMLVLDNSGVNNKMNFVDTTKSFLGYEGGIIRFSRYGLGGEGFAIIQSVSTTTNSNDTVNFNYVYTNDIAYINISNGYTGEVFKKYGEVTGIVDGYIWQEPGYQMVDTTKNFSGYEGRWVQNLTDGSIAKVDLIKTTTNPNDTLHFEGSLRGGSDNFWQIGDSYRIIETEKHYNHILISSSSGNPLTQRNLKYIAGDDAGSGGYTILNKGVRLYGITFICSNAIGINFQKDYAILEKCRLMWCGKHCAGLGFIDVGNSLIKQCFVYQNVLLNWPVGSEWGGGGGWPQAIQFFPKSPFSGQWAVGNRYDGNIVLDNGGEGISNADILENNIVADNYSMNIYIDLPNQIIRNNVVIAKAPNLNDLLTDFYIKAFYNGKQRNFSKIFPSGIVQSSENAGYHEIIENIQMYNNISIGNWRDQYHYYEVNPNGWRNCLFCNNTLVLSPENPIQTVNGEQIGLSEPTFVGMHFKLSNIDTTTVIKNNIIISTNTNIQSFSGRIEHVLIHSHKSNGDYPIILFDKNLYSAPGNSSPFRIENTNVSFSSFKSTTGWDSNSTLTDTPGLVGTDFSIISNIHKKHLKLLSTSVGVDTGEDLSAYFTTDFDGNTRPFGAVWDKGAIEYRPTDEDFTKEAVTSLGATDANLATEFIPVEYDYLDAIDNRPAQVTATNKYGVFLLKTRSSIGQPPLSIKWVGKTNIPGTSSTITLQIYNRNSTTWETLATNSTVAANTQFTMIATVTNNLSNYYDSDNVVACRVYQQATAV